MNGFRKKTMVLMTFSLIGLSDISAAVGEPFTSQVEQQRLGPQPNCAVPPDSPRVQPPTQSPVQFTAPLSEVPPAPSIAPASGINLESGRTAMPAEPYAVTAGDRIAVVIANVPEFSAQYQVQVDGTISALAIGAVSIWGLTVDEIAKLLTDCYVQTKMLRDPTITVNLLTVSPLQIAISGEVNRPGSYSLPSADGKLPTLAQAIQQAGGITHQADLRHVTLIRPRRSGMDDTYQINLWELLQSGDLRQDITLRDGDSIILAAAPVNSTEAGLLGAATVSPTFIEVGILGEARQSGVVQVPPNTPLNQALLAAGGFSSRAGRGSVELIRLNRDGSVIRRRIAIDLSAGINEETNPVLQNRDVILVGRNFIATLSDNLSAILAPVNQIFSIFTLFSTLFPASSGGSSNVIIPTGGGTATPAVQTNPRTSSSTNSSSNLSTNPSTNSSSNSPATTNP